MSTKLTERADGRYVAKYHGKCFYGSTSAEAKRKRDAYKAAQLLGLKQPQPAETVSSYAGRWLPTAKASVSPRVYNNYASLLDRLIAAMGDTPISQVTPTDVKSVYNTMLGASDSMVKKARMIYTAMFDGALEDGLITVNPARSRAAKPHRGTAGTHRILTPEEVQLIHQVDHRVRPFALTMYYAGLRRGEALALDIDRDVDFKAKVIHVTEAVRYESNKAIITDPKTEAGRRDVPLFPALEAVLKGCHGLLLPGPDGKHCTEQAFSRAWESYNNALSRAANNGLQKRWWGRTKEHKAILAEDIAALPPYKEINLRCHDFRHSFCTELCNAGVDLHVAITWLGHADEKMIMSVYDHVTPARIQTATALASAHFGSQNGSQPRKKYRLTRKK